MMEVLVVGAGLAGIYAAWQLERAGHDVQVLEARERVGGRTWSHRLSNGEVVERGSEFIMPTDHLLRQVSAELELPLIPHGIVFSRRWSSLGTRHTPSELLSATKALKDAIKRMGLEGNLSASLDEAAKQAWGGAYQTNPAYIRIVTSLANDPAKISALSFLARHGSGDTPYLEHGARVQAGNQAVSLEIEKRLRRPVRFNHVVKAFAQEGNSVSIMTTEDQRFTGDAAVLALPLPILRDLDGYHDLDVTATSALDSRTMGTAAKISIATVGQAPARGVQYPGAMWWCWNSLAHDDDNGRGAVTGFAGGHSTVEGLQIEDGGVLWKVRIKEIRPDLDLGEEWIITDWTQDEFTRGAYSSAGLAWRQHFVNAFDTLCGRIAIAGEHTVEPTMNGAIVSGDRAARLVKEMLA